MTRTTQYAVALAMSLVILCLVVYSITDVSAKPSRDGAIVTLTGTVSQEGRPIPGLFVSLLNGDGVRTGPNGEFSLAADSAGDHSLFIKTLPNMTSTDRAVSLQPGHNNIHIDLPPTSVELAIESADGGALPPFVQLLLHGPSSPNSTKRGGFVLRDDVKGATLVGMDWGEYTIFAISNTGVVSLQPATITLSPETPRAVAKLVLARRPLTLLLENADGLPLSTVLYAYGRTIRGRGGRFDLSVVAPGEHLQVSHPGYVPTCTRAAADTTLQKVRLTAFGTASMELILSPASTRPIGLLSGVAGSDCPIAVQSFPTQGLPNADAGSFAFRIDGLHQGTYEYRADATAVPVTISVPGPAVRYSVPKRCLSCG